MNKKIITPNPSQPIDRVPSGQLPSALAELCEEALVSGEVSSSSGCSAVCFGGGGIGGFGDFGIGGFGDFGIGGSVQCFCSHEGDDE